MSEYVWIIVKDHIATPDAPSGTFANAVGLKGPRGAPDDLGVLFDLFVKGGCQPFKMYDDDGELYYEGLIAGDYDGFEPLDDFGRPNAGCTRIDYRHNGKWEEL